VAASTAVSMTAGSAKGTSVGADSGMPKTTAWQASVEENMITAQHKNFIDRCIWHTSFLSVNEWH
ncbi:MAG TPA: hypothetical protein PKM21_17665, partial [Anaerolineales bacterium]|nr:hypothetical protein [Anaerolineales bacterium]